MVLPVEWIRFQEPEVSLPRRSFHQRMSHHSRRRRVMLVGQQQRTDAALETLDVFEPIPGSEVETVSPAAEAQLAVAVLPAETSAETSRPVPHRSEAPRKKKSRQALAELRAEEKPENSQRESLPTRSFSSVHRICQWLQEPQPRTWMFVGDETTAWMRYQGQPGYAEMFRHRLRWELKRTSDVVVNAGLQGATLADLQELIYRGLKQRPMDVVFLLPGQQDLEQVVHKAHHYAGQLTKLVHFLREQNMEPVLQTPPLPHRQLKKRSAVQLSRQADLIREVALTEEVLLIDHAEYWMEQSAAYAWAKAETGRLNSAGQAVMAFLLFTELDLHDRNSLLCKRLQQVWQKKLLGESQTGEAPLT